MFLSANFAAPRSTSLLGFALGLSSMQSADYETLCQCYVVGIIEDVATAACGLLARPKSSEDPNETGAENKN
jgi:hypothetical protein